MNDSEKTQIIELKQNISDEQSVIEQIELLIHALISTETEITNRFSFYSNIGSGIKIEANWIPHLSKHPKLYKATLFAQKTVIQRFIDELKIMEFLFIQHRFEYCNEIQPLWINYHKIQRVYHPIFLTAKFKIIQTKQNSEQIIKHISFQYISAMILYLNSDTNDEYSIFVDSPLFIQNNSDNFLFLQKYRKDFMSKNIEINGKAVIRHTVHHETFEFDSLKICADGLLTVWKWLDYTWLNGSLQIYSENDIVIEQNGRISVMGKGYYRPYGFGQGKPDHAGSSDVYFGGGGYGTRGQRRHRTGAGGKVYGEPELKRLWFGSPGAKEGGGILELISKGNIINYGTIDARGMAFGGGSGGSVKLLCKTLRNEGEILAEGDRSPDHGPGGEGRIVIMCENMENNGVVKPAPNLKIIEDVNDVISDGNKFTVVADEYYEKRKDEREQRQVSEKEKLEKMLVDRKVREDEEKRRHFLQLQDAKDEEIKEDKTEILEDPKKCCVVL